LDAGKQLVDDAMQSWLNGLVLHCFFLGRKRKHRSNIPHTALHAKMDWLNVSCHYLNGKTVDKVIAFYTRNVLTQLERINDWGEKEGRCLWHCIFIGLKEKNLLS